MKNDAISAVLEHLCNEARNSMHATFGVMDLLRDVSTDPAQRTVVAIGRASADQLLRSIDDVRELLSDASSAPVFLDTFDFALQAAEIIEVLNMASKKHRRHMRLEPSSGPLLLTQNRKGVEELLTRVLDAAFRLTQATDVHVSLDASPDTTGFRLSVHARDTYLAERLIQWLGATLDDVGLQDSADVPFAVAVMVAGKRLRALRGTSALVRDAAQHCTLVITLPSLVQEIDNQASLQDSQPDSLNILVAEDCDDSFALSELMLQDEHVKRARDGQEALHMIQRQRFDVVFMDIHMPGMDGYTVIRKMRDWETETGNARTPIVVLSSDELEAQRGNAAQSGCSGFLRKPLMRRDLTNVLDRLKQARVPAA